MATYSTLCGIDVSKDQFDVCYLKGDQSTKEQHRNEEATILKWIDQLDKRSTMCVIEPTGSYSSKLIFHLSNQGVALCVVNPNQSNHFTRALGIINKNDEQAAHTLALMAKSLDLALYEKPTEDMLKRKQILSSLNALKKQRQMLQNQLHALSYQPIIQPKVQQAFEQTLETVQQQIKNLEEELDSLSDEEHQQLLDKIRSVTGIGPKTARALILATGGLHNFKHHRQLAKFIGIVPTSHRSGSSVRFKGRITKHGASDLRATLYMAARSAKRFNGACQELYDRLRSRGKSHKQAMVAVMNKLIRQIFAVVTNDVPFDNQYYLKFKKT